MARSRMERPLYVAALMKRSRWHIARVVGKGGEIVLTPLCGLKPESTTLDVEVWEDPTGLILDTEERTGIYVCRQCMTELDRPLRERQRRADAERKATR